MAKDPYKLLGVKKTASDKEIKSAYRKLAKKWHPDKNPGDKKAAEKFKEMSAAYTLLSDKELRRRYDSGEVDASGQQQNPFAGAGGAGGYGGAYRTSAGTEIDPDLSDLFSSLFGMRGFGGQMGGGHMGGGAQPFGRAQMPRQKGADVQYALTISLPEAVKGVVKQVRLANGRSLKIRIPEGTKDGATLRLKGKGEPGLNGGPSGDARIKISVKPHKSMRWDGKTLRMDVPITLKEAVLGGKIKVPTPKGPVNLTLKPGTNSGKTLRLKGKGPKGSDLLVRLMIELPEKLGEDLKDCVKQWSDEPDPREKIPF